MSNYINELSKQKEILEEQGYRVAYICLYGSQNYGLDIFTDEYQSDIDMKAVIVPTLDDLINNSKPISTTIETEWGQCDLKDIRTYFEKGIVKANPAYLETLYTDYYIVDESFQDEFDEIFSMRDDLVHATRSQMIRAMHGMMCEKKKAMCHPYPTIKHKIDKFGYDGKQVHHILRLYIMMSDYFLWEKPLKTCLKSFSESNKALLMDLKLNKMPMEKAMNLAEHLMADGQKFKEIILGDIDESTIDYSAKYAILELSKEILKKKIIEEVNCVRME